MNSNRQKRYFSTEESQLIDAKTRVFLAIKSAYDESKDQDVKNTITSAFTIKNNFDANDKSAFINSTHTLKQIESEIEYALDKLNPWIGTDKSDILRSKLRPETFSKSSDIINKTIPQILVIYKETFKFTENLKLIENPTIFSDDVIEKKQSAIQKNEMELREKIGQLSINILTKISTLAELLKKNIDINNHKALQIIDIIIEKLIKDTITKIESLKADFDKLSWNINFNFNQAQSSIEKELDLYDCERSITKIVNHILLIVIHDTSTADLLHLANMETEEKSYSDITLSKLIADSSDETKVKNLKDKAEDLDDQITFEKLKNLIQSPHFLHILDLEKTIFSEYLKNDYAVLINRNSYFLDINQRISRMSYSDFKKHKKEFKAFLIFSNDRFDEDAIVKLLTAHAELLALEAEIKRIDLEINDEISEIESKIAYKARMDQLLEQDIQAEIKPDNDDPRSPSVIELHFYNQVKNTQLDGKSNPAKLIRDIQQLYTDPFLQAKDIENPESLQAHIETVRKYKNARQHLLNHHNLTLHPHAFEKDGDDGVFEFEGDSEPGFEPFSQPVTVITSKPVMVTISQPDTDPLHTFKSNDYPNSFDEDLLRSSYFADVDNKSEQKTPLLSGSLVHVSEEDTIISMSPPETRNHVFTSITNPFETELNNTDQTVTTTASTSSTSTATISPITTQSTQSIATTASSTLSPISTSPNIHIIQNVQNNRLALIRRHLRDKWRSIWDRNQFAENSSDFFKLNLFGGTESIIAVRQALNKNEQEFQLADLLNIHIHFQTWDISSTGCFGASSAKSDLPTSTVQRMENMKYEIEALRCAVTIPNSNVNVLNNLDQDAVDANTALLERQNSLSQLINTFKSIVLSQDPQIQQLVTKHTGLRQIREYFNQTDIVNSTNPLQPFLDYAFIKSVCSERLDSSFVNFSYSFFRFFSNTLPRYAEVETLYTLVATTPVEDVFKNGPHVALEVAMSHVLQKYGTQQREEDKSVLQNLV